MHSRLSAAVLGLAATMWITASASASVLAGLDGGTIVLIDASAMKVMRSVKVDGATKLVGLDVRPSDGKLYGLTQDGSIVVVDATTGKWEKKSQVSEKLPEGAIFTVDFNPAADRLRVIGSDGSSLRINVDDGKTVVDGRLKYAESDVNKSKPAKVAAGAYSNSFAGTKETALYDIDVSAGTLVKQAPPNDGILNTVGSLGVQISGPVAFDIASDGKGGNTGWLLMGATLYRVDLATGQAQLVGPVPGLSHTISDFAVMTPN
jgi:outer membrane protein assembly factor BamB